MIITIHQPEHFPYMGYFQKMNAAELFVVLDNVKFRKNYYQNRNKFINKQGNEEWFGVAVPKKSNSLIIKDVMAIDEKTSKWRRIVNNKIKTNFGIDLSYVYDSNKLIDINMKSIEWARQKLNINVPIVFASELNVQGSRAELLANICKEVGATKYISGPSGKEYLDLSYFNGISVEFFKPDVENYFSCLYNLQHH